MALCSSTFIKLGRSQAKALGVPALPILEVPHPFGLKTKEEIKEIAQDCLQQIEHYLQFGTTHAIPPVPKN
ncbi:hypothetical protein SAMN06296008_102153 [Polynucleobacter kasalickyi]|uniref:UGSC-like domain-containing protein n=3 Tax=Polynucleobacter kasalickyi TaxID=1938817 RepID=A0A1W1Y9Z3_9BURK|nr:hypothetical protein SAMN06296008_102153 [Polynucleobacter kasalickyi]